MINENEFYDLIAYIASAAKEMHIDPQIYAPLRLLTTMLRLIELMNNEKELDWAFLNELKSMLLKNQFLLSRDENEFGEFLDSLITKIAKKSFS